MNRVGYIVRYGTRTYNYQLEMPYRNIDSTVKEISEATIFNTLKEAKDAVFHAPSSVKKSKVTILEVECNVKNEIAFSL